MWYMYTVMSGPNQIDRQGVPPAPCETFVKLKIAKVMVIPGYAACIYFALRQFGPDSSAAACMHALVRLLFSRWPNTNILRGLLIAHLW